MNSIIPEKAYFRIGEVSKILDVEPYVIRYWETEFKTVKPVRTKAAQRLYRNGFAPIPFGARLGLVNSGDNVCTAGMAARRPVDFSSNMRCLVI